MTDEEEPYDLRAVTVSEKGQVAIPIDIRRKLNIRKGQRLILEVSGDKLLLAKSEDISRKMKNDFSHLIAISERTAKRLWENKKDAIWDKV